LFVKEPIPAEEEKVGLIDEDIKPHEG